MRRFYRRRLSQLLQKLMIPLGFVLMGLGAGVMAGILNEDVSGIPRSHRVIPPLALPADLSLPPSGAQIMRLTAAGAPGSPQTPTRPARSPEAAPALRTALTTPRQPGTRSPQEDPFQPGFNSPVPLERPRSTPPSLDGRPRPTRRGRLALVIDDIGYNLGALATLLDLGAPITYSIIPGLAYTQSSARMIQDQGREFIIHMPMEPLNYPREDPGENALMISQDVGEIRHRLEAYLSELPGAMGASNHMGSAYTQDVHRMAVVQEFLAERSLFFLNSMTIGTEVPGRIAQTRGYSYLQRDVFLDHDLDERAIERAFQQAVHTAHEQGYAIAIGHPHPQTLRVLRRNLPALARAGVDAVTLSSLLPR